MCMRYFFVSIRFFFKVEYQSVVQSKQNKTLFIVVAVVVVVVVAVVVVVVVILLSTWYTLKEISHSNAPYTHVLHLLILFITNDN